VSDTTGFDETVFKELVVRVTITKDRKAIVKFKCGIEVTEPLEETEK